MLSPRSYCIIAAPEGQSQRLRWDVNVANTTCRSCCVLHDFPVFGWLLHTAFVTKTKTCVSDRTGWWGKPSASPGEITGKTLKVVARVELLSCHVTFAVTHFHSKATVKAQESQEMHTIGNICIYLKTECCSYFEWLDRIFLKLLLGKCGKHFELV